MGLLVLKRPCSCGSGRTARSCCGLFRPVGQRDAATAYLGRQARQARDLIGPFSPAAMTTMWAEAVTLPARCDLFTDTLLVSREPVGSEVRKLARALERSRSGQLGSRQVLAALESADSPMARVAVAKALVIMREAGHIDEYLAAAAFLELAAVASPITEAALLAAGRSVAGLDLPPAEAPAPDRSGTAAGGGDWRREPGGGRTRTLAGRAVPAHRHGVAGGRA